MKQRASQDIHEWESWPTKLLEDWVSHGENGLSATLEHGSILSLVAGVRRRGFSAMDGYPSVVLFAEPWYQVYLNIIRTLKPKPWIRNILQPIPGRGEVPRMRIGGHS